MRNVFSLLPEGIGSLMVAHGVPTVRRDNIPQARFNRWTFGEFYRAEDCVGWWGNESSGERVVLVDKTFPHARFDAMLLVADDDVKASVSEVSRSTLEGILDLGQVFAEFTADPAMAAHFGLGNAKTLLAFNFDRLTVDRDNGQFFDKRFHLHLNCWPESDLTRVRGRRLQTVTRAEVRKSLLDPVAYLGPVVMRDALRADNFATELLPIDPSFDVQHRLPVGLKLVLAPEVRTSSSLMAELLLQLHAVAERSYVALHEAFTGTAPRSRAWWRATLLDDRAVAANLRDLPWLSDESREHLLRLRKCLRSLSEAQLQVLRRRPRMRSALLAMAGLDYHIGFGPDDRRTAQAGDWLLYMQFKMFSRVGGGPALGDTSITQFDRSAGPCLETSQELLRREFQATFVDRVKRSNRGGALLSADRRREGTVE